MKTKENNIYNQILLILIIICLVATTLLGTTSFAFAENISDFDKSSVYNDLRQDSSFNVTDYPTDINRQLEVIRFFEYGYKQNGEQDKYSLYMYLYNPKLIDINSARIQLKGNKGNFDKYELEFISKSNDENMFFSKNKFYKYKVKNAEKILANLDSTNREYTISGIEIKSNNNTITHEYTVATTYTITGYAKGCSADSMTESTLQQYANKCTVINLDIQSTFFRTNSSSLGKDHQNTLNSVYFAIPNYILNNYGELQVITATWDEQKTAPIFVTSSQENYNNLSNYLGVKAEDTPYSFCGGTSDFNTSTGGYIKWVYEYGFNLGKYSTTLNEIVVSNRIDRITNLFYTDGINASNYYVRGTELNNYIKSYDKSYVKGKLPNGISKDCLSDKVDNGRTQGKQTATIDTRTDKFDMLSYNSNHNWWQAYKDYGFSRPSDLGTDYTNIDPLYKVSKDDLGRDNIANNLLIYEKDKDRFIKYCNNAYNNQQTPYLFRFAVTDYYSTSVDNYKTHCNFAKGDYMATQTIFLDFDIISLSFYKEGIETIIPAVANPIDIVNDITPPVNPESLWQKILQFLQKYWKYFVLGLIILVAICTIHIWLPLLLKLILWLIKLPFVIIAKLYKSIKARAMEREQDTATNSIKSIQELEKYEAKSNNRKRKKNKS